MFYYYLCFKLIYCFLTSSLFFIIRPIFASVNNSFKWPSLFPIFLFFVSALFFNFLILSNLIIKRIKETNNFPPKTTKNKTNFFCSLSVFLVIQHIQIFHFSSRYQSVCLPRSLSLFLPLILDRGLPLFFLDFKFYAIHSSFFSSHRIFYRLFLFVSLFTDVTIYCFFFLFLLYQL